MHGISKRVFRSHRSKRSKKLAARLVKWQNAESNAMNEADRASAERNVKRILRQHPELELANDLKQLQFQLDCWGLVVHSRMDFTKERAA